MRRLRGLFTNRMVILAMVFAVILFFLWQNLFKLQVLNSRTYDELDPGTYVSTAFTDGTRGEIYDRYGRALAYNEYTWSLYYDSSTKFIFLSKLKLYFCVILSAESDISSLEKIISLFIM